MGPLCKVVSIICTTIRIVITKGELLKYRPHQYGVHFMETSNMGVHTSLCINVVTDEHSKLARDN